MLIFNETVWQAGGMRSVGAMLLLLPLMLPAIGFAAIVINLIFRMIGPLGRLFEREAIVQNDPERRFVPATRKLIRRTLFVLLPIACGLSLIGAILI